MEAVRDYVEEPGERFFLKPQVVPICTECLGTEACNTTGEAEALVSCWGCGQSVHPSCRVYATELVAYFEQHGWTCDDCKACIVCDQSPSESEKSEDLLVCEYCDQGIHYSCLAPQPEKRPKVWNCDDCRTARGMKPLGNIKKFRAEVADLVKKAAAKSFFANRSMLGYEDSDSLDAQVVVVEDGEQDETSEVARPESAPPPLSPQALLSVPPLELPPSSAASPQLPPPSSESNSRSSSSLADGKLNSSTVADIAPPSHLSHEPSELRVKKSDKPAKFFKSAKKDKVPAIPSSEETGTKMEVLPHQMNGKHSEKEDEEDVDDDSVPSSAKKRKKGEKKAKSKAVVDTESDASGSETEQSAKGSETKVQAPGSKNNALDNIPNDIRFDPKNLANKPKGLVDALSSFFTPGLKRTSRTAMNSLLKPETVPKESPLVASSLTDSSGVTKVDEVKKVRLSVDEKETATLELIADLTAKANSKNQAE